MSGAFDIEPAQMGPRQYWLEMSMESSRLPDDLERRLGSHGFVTVNRSAGGPMGSATFLFTDDLIDIEAYDDRGKLGVSVGVRGGTTYRISVWLEVLGVEPPAPVSFDDQLSWVLDGRDDLQRVIEQDKDIAKKLRDVNWSSIKEALGLRPDADPDDPRTWRRA